MIHYYYGNGKGKTTAAMGLAVRALGYGKRVWIVQFLKNAPSGEVFFWAAVPDVQVCRGMAGKAFTFQMSEAEKAETLAIHNDNLHKGCEAVAQGVCDLLILDEVGDALVLGLLDEQALLDFLRVFGNRAEVVMTGHNAIPVLIERSDYVTHMQKLKHPYDQGEKARKGVEM